MRRGPSRKNPSVAAQVVPPHTPPAQVDDAVAGLIAVAEPQTPLSQRPYLGVLRLECCRSRHRFRRHRTCAVCHHLRRSRSRALHKRKNHQAQRRDDCGHEISAAANTQHKRRATPSLPPYATQKNRLTLKATKHASFYMSNSSADRNCHTLPLPFDLYYESFFDQKLYQFFRWLFSRPKYADGVMVLRYRFSRPRVKNRSVDNEVHAKRKSCRRPYRHT